MTSSNLRGWTNNSKILFLKIDGTTYNHGLNLVFYTKYWRTGVTARNGFVIGALTEKWLMSMPNNIYKAWLWKTEKSKNFSIEASMTKPILEVTPGGGDHPLSENQFFCGVTVFIYNFENPPAWGDGSDFEFRRRELLTITITILYRGN